MTAYTATGPNRATLDIPAAMSSDDARRIACEALACGPWNVTVRRADGVEPARAQSLLPNSSPFIREPMARGFRVVWHDDIDSHILYRDAEPIAAHHNGYSCHNLAERILAGNAKRALDQFDYIKACGGTHYVSRETLESLI